MYEETQSINHYKRGQSIAQSNVKQIRQLHRIYVKTKKTKPTRIKNHKRSNQEEITKHLTMNNKLTSI